MLPAYPITLQCPACLGGIEVAGSVSGNTLGAEFWTDGKAVYPNQRLIPRLGICPHCRGRVWLDQAASLRRLLEEAGDEAAETRQRLTESMRNARYCLLPDEEDYLQELATPQPPEREIDLRFCVWWESNDRYRKPGNEEAIVFTPAQQENVRRLAGLLDDAKPMHLLLKAEIHRELGEVSLALRECEKVSACLKSYTGRDASDIRHFLPIQLGLAFRNLRNLERYF